MEILKVASNGQWSLEKAVSPEYKQDPDNNYLSYRSRSLTGELPVDHGTKGQLHNNGNTRAPRTVSNERMKGKVATPVESATIANNPGDGI